MATFLRRGITYEAPAARSSRDVRFETFVNGVLDAGGQNIDITNAAQLGLSGQGVSVNASNGDARLVASRYVINDAQQYVISSTAGLYRWLVNPAGHTVPDVTNTYDIGSTTYKVRHIHTGGEIHCGTYMFGGTQILAGQDSAGYYLCAGGTAVAKPITIGSTVNTYLSLQPAKISLAQVPTYSGNVTAVAGGLVAGMLYKTETGEVRIVI